MDDIENLEKLIEMLRNQGVSKLKTGTLEIELFENNSSDENFEVMLDQTQFNGNQ